MSYHRGCGFVCEKPWITPAVAGTGWRWEVEKVRLEGLGEERWMFHRGASVKQRPLRATPSILVFTPQPMGPTAEAPQPGGCAAYGCELNGNLEYGESFVNKPRNGNESWVDLMQLSVKMGDAA